MPSLLESLRANLRNCITTSCHERNCTLRLDDISVQSLLIIHGSRYQRCNGLESKLCDRILIRQYRGLTLAAIELKGGRNLNLTDAIKQIQNGLNVASTILGSLSVSYWFPLLLYSGNLDPRELRILRTRRVDFRGTNYSL